MALLLSPVGSHARASPTLPHVDQGAPCARTHYLSLRLVLLPCAGQEKVRVQGCQATGIPGAESVEPAEWGPAPQWPPCPRPPLPVDSSFLCSQHKSRLGANRFTEVTSYSPASCHPQTGPGSAAAWNGLRWGSRFRRGSRLRQPLRHVALPSKTPFQESKIGSTGDKKFNIYGSERFRPSRSSSHCKRNTKRSGDAAQWRALVTHTETLVWSPAPHTHTHTHTHENTHTCKWDTQHVNMDLKTKTTQRQYGSFLWLGFLVSVRPDPITVQITVFNSATS
jgi:hypothetical protein